MRRLELDTNKVQFLPASGWAKYEVQNDQHGGLIAVVYITDDYAKQIEELGLSSNNLAVMSLWRKTL
jgi:hypothetical protein